MNDHQYKYNSNLHNNDYFFDSILSREATSNLSQQPSTHLASIEQLNFADPYQPNLSGNENYHPSNYGQIEIPSNSYDSDLSDLNSAYNNQHQFSNYADAHKHILDEVPSNTVTEPTSVTTSYFDSESSNDATSHTLNEDSHLVTNHNVTEINYEPITNQSQTFNFSPHDVVNAKPGDHLKVHHIGSDYDLSPTDSCPGVTVQSKAGYAEEQVINTSFGEIPVDFMDGKGHYYDHAFGSHKEDIREDSNKCEQVQYYNRHNLDPNSPIHSRTVFVDKYIVKKDHYPNEQLEVRSTQLAKLLNDSPSG